MINVKKSDILHKVDIVGFTGKTERVTGLHLHYEIRIYSTTVDPIGFHNIYNKGLQ